MIENLHSLQKLVAGKATLVAVSKTYGADSIEPYLQAGQRVYGENRVQEAQEKWPKLKAQYQDVELHMIGPLQSNKVQQAVKLFDVIQSVDRLKIAQSLAREMKIQSRQLPCYIQVNIGNEEQKSGVAIAQVGTFYRECQELGLNIVGLMCIPPADQNPRPYFQNLSTLANELGISKLSMGMSNDYEIALQEGATCIRVGSALFGARS